MDKNPLLHRLMKTSKEEVVHSSGYAQAQTGGSMGAASSASFAARQAIDQARNTIKKYGASKIANNSYGNTVGAKRYEPSAETPNYVERVQGRQMGENSSSGQGATNKVNTAASQENRGPKPIARKNPGIFR